MKAFFQKWLGVLRDILNVRALRYTVDQLDARCADLYEQNAKLLAENHKLSSAIKLIYPWAEQGVILQDVFSVTPADQQEAKVNSENLAAIHKWIF